MALHFYTRKLGTVLGSWRADTYITVDGIDIIRYTNADGDVVMNLDATVEPPFSEFELGGTAALDAIEPSWYVP